MHSLHPLSCTGCQLWDHQPPHQIAFPAKCLPMELIWFQMHLGQGRLLNLISSPDTLFHQAELRGSSGKRLTNAMGHCI